MLMPKQQTLGSVQDVKLNADPKDPAPFPAYLPLEIFDNEGRNISVISADVTVVNTGK